MNNSILFKKLLLPVLILSVIFLVQSVNAKDNFYITGTIYSTETNLPVSSIWVAIYNYNGTNRISHSLTGNDGKYYISGLDRGSYWFIISRGAYKIFQKRIVLSNNTTYDVSISTTDWFSNLDR